MNATGESLFRISQRPCAWERSIYELPSPVEFSAEQHGSRTSDDEWLHSCPTEQAATVASRRWTGPSTSLNGSMHFGLTVINFTKVPSFGANSELSPGRNTQVGGVPSNLQDFGARHIRLQHSCSAGQVGSWLSHRAQNAAGQD